MVSAGSEVECWEDELGLIHYRCSCGHLSRWDFDAPVPILLEDEAEG